MCYMEKEISTHHFITNYCILSHHSCRTLLISGSAHTSENSLTAKKWLLVSMQLMSQECMEFQKLVAN